MNNSLGIHSNGIKSILMKMVATVLAFVVLNGCASMIPKPDFYPQIGDPHTTIYKDSSGKEVAVFDLTGKWETYYLGKREVANIIQKGSSFQGYKTIGGTSGKGSLTIFGNVDGNLVVCYTQLYRTGTSDPLRAIYYTSKITKNIDSFECSSVALDSSGHHAIFKRIE